MRYVFTQMAADLGHSLAAATNSIGSQLLTLAGQSSAAAVDNQDTSQVRTSYCSLPYDICWGLRNPACFTLGSTWLLRPHSLMLSLSHPPGHLYVHQLALDG